MSKKRISRKQHDSSSLDCHTFEKSKARRLNFFHVISYLCSFQICKNLGGVNYGF